MAITVSYEEGLRFRAWNGDHQVVIDLPEGVGGSNRGMSPPQLFIASLGSCIGVYVVDYCKRAGISCQGMKIHLDWKIKDDPKRIGDIGVKIELPSCELPPARKKAILSVAEHCLVHNTIHHLPEVDIQLETGGRSGS